MRVAISTSSFASSDKTPIKLLKARDIETRYMNYPARRNYKKDDLERIIYGKN